MARKLRRESATVFRHDLVTPGPSDLQPDPPTSSGDTLLINPDVNMMNDEGYETNRNGKKANESQGFDSEASPSGSSSQTILEPSEGLKVLGQGVKELFEAVKELRHLGIEDLVLRLPKIVVVGDQSTGKSSLIEGISGIKVPRSAGTCTRCPLELNLIQCDTKESWNCQVSLVRHYKYLEIAKGIRVKPGASRGRPLGPWTPQEIEDLRFAEIRNKADVEPILRRAQLATLNPSRAWEAYLPTNNQTDNGYEVMFSPNVIRLDITGSEMPNLQFFDLPGVINDTGNDEEEYLATLVKNLVKEYIMGENCINLLTLAMTDDPQNSSAWKLIKGVKGAKERTMGVLTKPDRLEKNNAHEQWIDILESRKFEVGYGYFVVKNNSNPAVDHLMARCEEEAFFDTDDVWTNTLGQYSDRFGTPVLQSALSRTLEIQIRSSLPNIFAQVSQKALSIDAKILELPEPEIKNPQLTVWTELTRLANDLEKHISGGSGDYPFQKAWDDLSRSFRGAVVDSSPKMLPHPNSTNSSGGGISATPTPMKADSVIDLSDDEGPATFVTPTKVDTRKRPCPSAQSTPSKVPRKMSEVPRYESVMPIRATKNRIFTLGEIRDKIRDDYIGIQGQIHPHTIENMIKTSMEHWDGLLESFLENAKSHVRDLIVGRIQITFERRQHTQFYKQVFEICEKFLKDITVQHTQIIKGNLRWEQNQPKTLDDSAAFLAREKARKILQQGRLKVRAKIVQDEQEQSSGRMKNEEAKMKDLEKIMEAQSALPDEYQQEVDTMAKVRGYYECASSRFVDTVCMSIQHEVFEKCRNDMVSVVRHDLGVSDDNGPERCGLLLAASPEDLRLRQQLVKERDTLCQAQERLERLSSNE